MLINFPCFVLAGQAAHVPVVTLETYEAILYLLNKGNSWRPRDQEKRGFKELLSPIINDYCQITGYERPQLQFDQQGINYLATSLTTNLEENVKQHFVQQIRKYVNIVLQVRQRKLDLANAPLELEQFLLRVEEIKKVGLRKQHAQEYMADYPENEQDVLEELLNLPFPLDPPDEDDDGNLDHDDAHTLEWALHLDPGRFLPTYVSLARMYEDRGLSPNKCIPLRTSHIQSHVRIDTSIMAQNILHWTKRQYQSTAKMDIWRIACRVDSKAFKPKGGLSFAGNILTDGMAVCTRRMKCSEPTICFIMLTRNFHTRFRCNLKTRKLYTVDDDDNSTGLQDRWNWRHRTCTLRTISMTSGSLESRLWPRTPTSEIFFTCKISTVQNSDTQACKERKRSGAALNNRLPETCETTLASLP